MSHSEEKRKQDVIKALTLMISSVGDRALDSIEFERAQPPYDEIYPTTWEELKKSSYVELVDYMSKEVYALTGQGWLAGIRAAGLKRDRQFDSRVQKLFAELKRSVDDRLQDAFVWLDGLAGTLAIPEGWIFNAIESNLLEREYGRHGVAWAPQQGKGAIRVPKNFGLTPLEPTLQGGEEL